MMSAHTMLRAATASLLAFAATTALAQDWKPSFTLHGDAGLIDMPTAGRMADGTLAVTAAQVGPHSRLNLAFQITPRLTGVLRYDLERRAGGGSDLERAVDLRYRLLDETAMLPAISVGARNIVGNGRDSAEYIVASKSFGSRMQASAGLGWGRLASHGGFANPLGAQSRAATPSGRLGVNPIFQGQAAAFAGIEYSLSDAWRIKAEYASDAYARETADGRMKADSPFSFGVSYSPSRRLQLGAYAVQGRDYGITASLIVDPNRGYALTGVDPAPLPVGIPDAAAAQSWSAGPGFDAQTAPILATAMANDGLVLHGIETRGHVMRVRYENTQYRAEAQGLGRMARVLSQVAPAGVTEFHLEPVALGVPKSRIVVPRADLVALENELGAAEDLLARVRMQEAGSAEGLTPAPSDAPKFGWSIGPYFTFGQVGASNRFQYQAGLEASFRYDFAENFFVSGAVRQRVTGNEASESVALRGGYPITRRDAGNYMLAKGPQLERLTMTHLGRAGPALYTRLTAGYLERMYGGVSGELLWKPVGSRLGLGAEITYAAKRDTQGLGFNGQNATTGFVSAYYEFDNDFVGRLDVGRYLAGDTGATLSLSREFPNGWRVGGYVTMTDMSAADFGEGGFDKGLTISVPINWLLGTPSRETRALTLSAGSADGGQRAETGQALYSLVRDGHRKDLADSWGRFWK